MNTILLNTVLSACEKGGQWRLALHFFSTWSRLADGTSWARLAVACCEPLADGPTMAGKDAATGDVCGRDEGLCWEPAVDGDVDVV